MEFILPTFTVSTIISLGLSLYLIVVGFMQIATGKVYGHSFEKYTVESVKKYARPAGILYFLIGTVIILAQFVKISAVGDSFRTICYGVAVALLVVYLIVSLCILKKSK